MKKHVLENLWSACQFRLRTQTHVDTVTQLRVRTKSAWHIVTFLLIIRLMQEEKLGVYDIEMTHKPYIICDELLKILGIKILCS